MTASLRALLANIIDYAGMFPPAQLPMDEAIRNYARYRTEPESWMLGRFICPAARLNELSPYVDELFRLPLPIVALGRGGNVEASIVEGLRQDFVEIDLFRARHGNRVSVDVFETKLPLYGPFQKLVILSNDGMLPQLQIFVEMARAQPIDFVEGRKSRIGVKIRCGGATAAAVPTSSAMYEFLDQYCKNDIPLKYTAGLHHPFRRYDPLIDATTYGFINVFSAGIFAKLGLSGANIIGILEDEDPTHFQFDNDGMSWRDLRATIPQIESARRNNVISFGSCSFDEPREDLKALGWL